jgi:uncharacterized protein YoxC
MGWAEVVTAISTAIIALVVLAVGVGLLLSLQQVKELRRVVDRTMDLLEHDARPALQSAKTMVDDASKVVAAVRSEALGITDASKDVRGRVERLMERTEERLQDLESLIDVVQFEVEETALDVAAALRTTRRGTSVLRAMKRAFLGRGR